MTVIINLFYVFKLLILPFTQGIFVRNFASRSVILLNYVCFFILMIIMITIEQKQNDDKQLQE